MGGEILNAQILVIEDNAVNQEVIGQMLRALGCQFQVSASALDGLKALCERRFDLVLMDIQMPGMDGVEALNWFRRSRSGRFNFLTPTETPVIAVTANALGGDEERFLELGFDDYLSKPFRQSQLLAMLSKRLRPAAPDGSRQRAHRRCGRARCQPGRAGRRARRRARCRRPRDDDLPEQPKVLLVDDDEVNLLLTSIALRERGFAITEATSGEQAIQILADWLPDVVVLDALMPGLDGFETCRELRVLPGFESLPVLMLTGLDDDASITRAYEAGATDFFVKSTQWSLLAGRLRYLLRASRTRRARAQQVAPGARARPGAHGQLRLAPRPRRPGVLGRGPARVRPRPDDRLALRAAAHAARPTSAAAGAVLHEVMKHSTVLATDIPATLRDGRQRIVHVEAEPEFNEHGNLIGYTGIVQDVTDRRMAEDKIRHLANFDALTGLPNRRQLIWRAERALEHGRRLNHQVALLLIDLDRFKVINDTLGHGAGDELLMEVARRLRSCVRHSDQVIESSIESMGSRSHRTLEAVGRLGGDEFVALLPEVADERDAERVATRILDLMREPIFVGGQECFVTASVGIALYPRDG
jgi:PleD family two-component response regulator